MTTEPKPRANTDYSKSAVNLCNPHEIMDMLAELHRLQTELAILENTAKSLVPNELKERIKVTEQEVAEQRARMPAQIDTFGSYQNQEEGHYALKQRKVSVTYLPEKVKQKIPQFAPAIIEETVNKVKIGGLLKGGLITQFQVDEVSVKTESFDYIIR